MSEIEPVFVDTIPDELKDGRLYIALKYRTVTHKCACGCGVEINTPLHPTGWSITYDGSRISLWPSVGNWSEKCESHYWIDKNRICWARTWTKDEVLTGRNRRLAEIREYFRATTEMDAIGGGKSTESIEKSLLEKLMGWLHKMLNRTDK